MAIQVQGYSGTIGEIEAGTRAQRIVARPFDHGAYGAYRYGGISGIIPAALAANSEIFQYRWIDATRLSLIRKVRISASVTTTMFAAGVPMQLELKKATAWSGIGTGGTRATIGAELKRESSMGSSLVGAGDIAIATTAALGGGTKALESLAMSTIVAGCPITASLNGTIITPGTIMWQSEVGDGEHPFILSQNEGFVIRCVAVPATGTWMFSIDIDWTEVASF